LAALLMAEDRTTRAAEERHLAAQMAALPPREQAVLRLRFGFDEEPLRPGQIAARLGVCRKTVYNLQERALNRLRVRVERT
jgi:RNA polymerase sigma factor (sigma-70 family)